MAALKEAESRKAALEAESTVTEAPAPRLPQNLADLYREKVAALQEALEGEDAVAAREQVRALIDEVVMIPSPTDPNAPLGIEVRGALAAMLALGSGFNEAPSAALASQIKLVAGARNHRKTHSSVLDIALVLNPNVAHSFTPLSTSEAHEGSPDQGQARRDGERSMLHPHNGHNRR